jgi:hypothetical protein
MQLNAMGIYLALADSLSIDDFTGVRGGGAPSQLARKLGLVDLTRDGNKTQGVVTDLARGPAAADFVTLTAGGNDLLGGDFPRAILRRLHQIAQRIQPLGARVVLNKWQVAAVTSKEAALRGPLTAPVGGRRSRVSMTSEQGSRRGCPVRAPVLQALANVEERAACVHAGCGRRHVVVRLVPLRRRDPLEDPGGRSRAVATNGENSAAAVRERDLENGCAVGPSPLVDVVDEAYVGLVIGAHPTDQRRDFIGAAPARGRAPGASAVHRTVPSSACGRDEVTGSCECDRVTIGSYCRGVTAGIYGRRGDSGRADDVPANVVSPA